MSGELRRLIAVWLLGATQGLWPSEHHADQIVHKAIGDLAEQMKRAG